MKPKVLLAVSLALLTGCATVPLGPTVQVMPAPGKPFSVFQTDDYECRQYAQQRTGTTPGKAASQQAISGAAIGTALGAVAGAVIGSASGHMGTGAAIGGGSGLLLGTAVGAGSGQDTGYSVQDRYNLAYEQCMYAKGNQVPGFVQPAPPPPPPAPAPPAAVPPPPPAAPPAR